VRSDQLIVNFGGLLGITWVYWYFFVAARKAGVAAVATTGTQEITITVDGGYSPSVITLKAGQPARLNFDRKDAGSCTEEVVFADFGIRRFLPSGKTTAIEFMPRQPGSFEFTCGMGMVRGKLQVHE
jgi:plastocyanin domain-containing protein